MWDIVMPELSVAAMPTLASPPAGTSAAPRSGLPTPGLVDFAALLSQLRDAIEQDAQGVALVGEPSAASPDDGPPTGPVPQAGARLAPTWRADRTLDSDAEPKPALVGTETDDPRDEETVAADPSDDPVMAVAGGAAAVDPSSALLPALPLDQAPTSAAPDVPPSQPQAIPIPFPSPAPPSASAPSPTPTTSSRLDQRARSLTHAPRGMEPASAPTDPTAHPTATPDRAGYAVTTQGETARVAPDRDAASQEQPGRSVDAPPNTGHAMSMPARKDAPNMDASAPASMPGAEARSMMGASVGANARPLASADATNHRQPEPIDTPSITGGPSPSGSLPVAAVDHATGPDPVTDPRPPSPSPATQIAERVAPALMRVATSGLGTHDLTVRLDPAELGQVEIRIEQAPDVPSRVHILVERPETLSLLRQDQARLEQTLDRAGVRAEAREITLDLSPAGTITAQAVAPDRGVAPRTDDAFRAPDNPSTQSGSNQSGSNQSDPNRDPGWDQRPRHGDGRDAGFSDRPARGVLAASDDAGHAPGIAARPPADWRRLGLNITA